MTASDFIAQATPAVIPFEFEGLKVRTIVRDGAPWFVLADVCASLAIVNVADAAERLDDDEKGIANSDTLGGAQKVRVVSEGGLYTIVLRCQGATTQGSLPWRFRKWVTGTVLPSIRKTGSYGATPAINLDDPAFLRTALLSYTEKVIALQAEVVTLAPKAAALDLIESADGDLTLTAASKVLKIGPKALIAYLRVNGWIYRRHDDAPWVGHQARTNAGYLVHRVSRYTKPDGSEHVKEQVRVTPKGVAKLAGIFAASDDMEAAA